MLDTLTTCRVMWYVHGPIFGFRSSATDAIPIGMERWGRSLLGNALDFWGCRIATLPVVYLFVGETADGHADFACLPPWCDKSAGEQSCARH